MIAVTRLLVSAHERLLPPLRPDPEDQEHEAEREREQVLDGVVRVERVDRRLADDQAEDAGERRADHEADQERDAVRARTRAADDDERRSQDERAGCRDDRVEDDVEAGTFTAARRGYTAAGAVRSAGRPTPRPWRPRARAR